MTPSIFGILLVLIGGFLMTRSLVWMLSLFLIATLFGGASAVDLPMLGGASVQPSLFVLVLLAVRLFLAKSIPSRWVGAALRENALLLAYCAYAAVTAFVLPQIFFHRIALVPMSAVIPEPAPLSFSTQNITTAFYLLGTGFAAVVAAIVAQDERAPGIIVTTMIVVTWGHILFGLADLGLSTIHQEKLLLVFRNGHYAQLDQTMTGSVHRIGGIMPEPSTYAGYGCVMLALMSELWIRGIASRATGPTALAMLTLVILSTSSAGYVTAAAYGFLIIGRIMFIPGAINTSRAVVVGVLALAAVGLALGALIFAPGMSEGAGDMLNAILFTKAQSESGVQRAVWARQGFDAFAVSGGFGVGVGSFRSSSLFTAILGSVGVIGISLFLAYLLQVFKPLRPSTYRVDVGSPRALGAAAGWAGMIMIMAAAVESPSSDPGALFAVLAGLSLAWRMPASSGSGAASRAAAYRPGLAPAHIGGVP